MATKKIAPLIFAALFSVCRADFPDSFDAGFGAGYRSDQLHYAISNPLSIEVSKIEFDPLRSAEVRGFVKGLYQYLYLHGSANYGWVCSGKGKFANKLDPSVDPTQPFIGVSAPLRFRLPHAGGNLFDCEGDLGVALPVWQRGNLYALLELFGGYSLHHQSISPGKTRPQVASITDLVIIPAPSTATESVSIARFKNTWWGPSLGAHLDVRPDEYFGFEAGYDYYFFHYTNRLAGVFILGFDVLGNQSSFLADTRTRYSSHSGRGQKFSGRVDYYVVPWCKIGLFGSILSAHTPKKRGVSFSQSGSSTFSNTVPGKASWKTYEVILDATFRS